MDLGDGITSVDVTLSVSALSGADIYLVEGDQLVANYSGDLHLLVREDDWPNTVRYLTAFQTEDAETMVSIAFERTGYEPALNSSLNCQEESSSRHHHLTRFFSGKINILIAGHPQWLSRYQGSVRDHLPKWG